MRIDKSKIECCGCTACANICTHKAITMVPDELGFVYPKINNDLCVDCGLCVEVCQFKEDYRYANGPENITVLAVRCRDIKELAFSQSGGMFYALSEKILDDGGVVYGAGYAEHCRVIHKRAVTKQERDDLRKSKYVQSDMQDVFIQVREDLKAGKQVLFSGTPCQVSGLKSFVSSRLHPLLFTVDLVCHGVPSPFVWRDYLKYMEKRLGEEILVSNFRDKSFGWSSHIETLKTANYKISKRIFSSVFYAHIVLRDSCFHCPYTNLKRVSDITIGDFWGWTDKHIEFADNKGISLVLINSVKGKKLFDSIQDNLYIIESNTKECLQPQLLHPSRPHKQMKYLRHCYIEHGFEYMARRCAAMGWRFYLKETVVYLKKIIKYIIGRK